MSISGMSAWSIAARDCTARAGCSDVVGWAGGAVTCWGSVAVAVTVAVGAGAGCGSSQQHPVGHAATHVPPLAWHSGTGVHGLFSGQMGHFMSREGSYLQQQPSGQFAVHVPHLAMHSKVPMHSPTAHAYAMPVRAVAL